MGLHILTQLEGMLPGWLIVLRLFLCGLKLNAIKSELLKEMMDEVQLIRGMWY